MFFAYMPFVYSQLDTSQLEGLLMLQQDEIDIDDPIEPYEDKRPLDKQQI